MQKLKNKLWREVYLQDHIVSSHKLFNRCSFEEEIILMTFKYTVRHEEKNDNREKNIDLVNKINIEKSGKLLTLHASWYEEKHINFRTHKLDPSLKKCQKQKPNENYFFF